MRDRTWMGGTNHQTCPTGPRFQDRHICQALQCRSVPEGIRKTLEHCKCFCVPNRLSRCIRENIEQSTHHTTASSILPASKNMSPRTLNNLPCDEAAPMPLVRFLPEAGAESVDWRRDGRAGPVDEVRFRAENFRKSEIVDSSDWL